MAAPILTGLFEGACLRDLKAIANHLRALADGIESRRLLLAGITTWAPGDVTDYPHCSAVQIKYREYATPPESEDEFNQRCSDTFPTVET